MSLVQEIFNYLDMFAFGRCLRLRPNTFRFTYFNDINYIHQHTDRVFISALVQAILDADYIRDVDFELWIYPYVDFYSLIFKSLSKSLDEFYYDFYHAYYGD